MNWTILGIEETKDKKAIKAAYRAKLASVNPEDHPEEFMELRAAYEEALKLADAEEVPETEKTDLDIWADKLSALYFNFEERINPECWKKLFSDEICVGLDTRQDAERRMLEFFLEHYRIPHNVWVYLDSEFSFSERIAELYEFLPKDFVDYVVATGIKEKEALAFDLFTPGKDGAACDRYIRLYNKMINGGPEDFESASAEIRTLPEQHPYGSAFMTRPGTAEKNEESFETLRKIYEQYPNDDTIVFEYVLALSNFERYSEAEQVAKTVYPENKSFGIGMLLGRALAAQNNYSEAVKLVDGLYTLAEGNPYREDDVNKLSREWNEKVLEELRLKVEAEPENYKLRYDYVIALNRSEHFEESDAQMAMFPEGQPDEYGYYNMHANHAIRVKDYETAYEMLGKQLEAGRKLVPDGTEVTQGRINNLHNLRFTQGQCLEKLGRAEEAAVIFEECLAQKPDDIAMAATLTYFYMRQNMNDKAVALAEQLFEKHPASPSVSGVYANALYKARHERDALDIIDRTLAMDSSNLYFYLLKMRLFARNKVEQGVEDVASFLADNQITDLPVIRWCKAVVSKDREEAPENLVSLYQEIETLIASEEPDEWHVEFYYDYARLTADVTDKQVTDNNYAAARPQIIEILNKGLAIVDNDEACLDYKGWLLKKDGNDNEALEIFKYLRNLPNYERRAANAMAEIYFKDLGRNADKAYECYSSVLKSSPEDSFLLYYTGMCLFYLNDLEGAANMFAKEQEVDPDDLDGFFRLSMVRTVQNRLEEGLELIDKAIAVSEKHNARRGFLYKYKTHILRRLGRFEEAIKVTEARADVEKGFRPYPVIVDINKQTGDYEAARQTLKAWHKAFPKDSEMRKEQIILDYHEDKKAAAVFAYDNYRSTLDVSERNDIDTIQMMFCAAEGGKVGKKSLFKKIKSLIDANPNPSAGNWITTTEKYLEALAMTGELETEPELVKKYLETCIIKAGEYSLYRMLHLTRLIYAYVFAGDEEKARATLELASKEHFCEFCPYSRCKDSEIAEVYIEAFLGDKKKGLELVEKLYKDWPDDLDVVYLKLYLERIQK